MTLINKILHEKGHRDHLQSCGVCLNALRALSDATQVLEHIASLARIPPKRGEGPNYLLPPDILEDVIADDTCRALKWVRKYVRNEHQA